MKVTVLKQFSIFMPNKPGALSRLAGLFAEKKINILGIASEVRDDSGMVRIALPSDSEVSSVLSQNGFSSVETNILSVEVSDKAGELFRLTSALAEGRINITTVYGTAFGHQVSLILIAVDNIEPAVKAMEGA